MTSGQHRGVFGEVTFLLGLAAVCAAAVALFHPDRPPWNLPPPSADEISVGGALSLKGKPLWVDARSQALFQQAHIAGALLLNEDHWNSQLGAVIEQWEPGRVVVVYCGSQSCDASHAVAARLRRSIGIEPVYVLQGGWEAWQNAKK